MQKIFSVLIFVLVAVISASAQCPGPSQRQALLNLQRAISVEGSRAGQIPLTDTCGNQLYAQYVEVNPDTVAYTPTSSGNTENRSEFVYDPTGTLWYIDWQGNAVQFESGAGACDADFLQISDNSCPDALTDSIYKYKYVAIGARYVWPSAELLISDSMSAGLVVIQGSRNARLGLYDSNGGTWSLIDHGGSTPVWYIPVDANLLWKTGTGTPQSPIGVTSHFAINSQDSTIQAHQYPNTRLDTETVENFLYTDGIGKFRSRPITYFQDSLNLNGIYGGNGQIPGTIATLDPAASMQFKWNNGNNAFLINTSGEIEINPPFGGTMIYQNDLAVVIGDANYKVTAYPDNLDVLINAATTQMEFADGYTQLITPYLGLSDGVNAAEFRIYEPSGSGNNYTGFKTAAMAGNTIYTLPTDTPADGDVLAWHTGNLLSWDASGGGGSGIYSPGSGNVPNGSISDLLGTYRIRTGSEYILQMADTITVLANSDGAGSYGHILSMIDGGTTHKATFYDANSQGLEYLTDYSSTGTDLTLVTKGFVLQQISDSLSSVSGCDSCIVTGGNSFGYAPTIGTNDNNGLNIETNNIVRASVTSGVSTGGAWTFNNITDKTNTQEDVLTIQTNSTSIPSSSFGASILFKGESSTTDNRDMAKISSIWKNATDANRSSEISFYRVNSGGSLTKQLSLDNSISGDGTLVIGVAPNTISISGNQINMPNGNIIYSSGLFALIGNSANECIRFNSSSNSNYINFGGATFNNTSGNKDFARFSASFSPTSGTGTYTDLQFIPNINQTGGSNGNVKSLYISPNIINLNGVYYSIDIGVNHANAKGIYQSGANTTNNFVGATAFGSTSAPDTEVDVTGTTSTEHLIGQNLTPGISIETSAGTGASASITGAQSSDLAGRFLITTGTSATTGLWATVTFDNAFSVTPIVQIYNEDADAASTAHYVNVSTTGFEFFIASGAADSTTFEYNYVIIGGK